MTADCDQERAAEQRPRQLLRRLAGSRGATAGLAIGILLFVLVVVWQGLGQVAAALRRAGWGVLVVGLLHVPQVWADGMGWRPLLPAGRRLRRRTMAWGRWVGESINDLLPVFQMGGNIVKAWLLVERGVPVGSAGGSVVVDITLVVLTQITFTLFGASVLVLTAGDRTALPVVATSVGIMAVLLAGFYLAQQRGLFGLLASLARRILAGRDWQGFSSGAGAVDADIRRLYEDRRALMASACWHLLAWFLGVAEVWLALYLLGHTVDVWTALIFESLGQAIRTGAFAIPGALGVQEGTYVFLGGAFGIPPGAALGLSLVRRVRELMLGIPGIISWQVSDVAHRSQSS